MTLTDKIKNLIADGNTQQAIDWLQDYLKEKHNTDILNQTYLLENQYKDLQKKMQLGLPDVSAEINRVNLGLLNLCDEAEKVPELPETIGDTEGGDKSWITKDLIIFGVIVAIVIFIVFGILYFTQNVK